MERRFTPKQYVNLFTADIADRQITELFTQEFGTLCGTPVVVSAAPRLINSEYFLHILQFTLDDVRDASS